MSCLCCFIPPKFDEDQPWANVTRPHGVYPPFEPRMQASSILTQPPDDEDQLSTPSSSAQMNIDPPSYADQTSAIPLTTTDLGKSADPSSSRSSPIVQENPAPPSYLDQRPQISSQSTSHKTLPTDTHDTTAPPSYADIQYGGPKKRLYPARRTFFFNETPESTTTSLVRRSSDLSIPPRPHSPSRSSVDTWYTAQTTAGSRKSHNWNIRISRILNAFLPGGF